MNIQIIETGKLKLDAGAMFGVVPKVMWSKIYPADEQNYALLTMRSLLVDTGNKVIIIDTGIGNKQDAQFFTHYQVLDYIPFSESLKKHGYNVNDITDVVHTHLHFDHCGESVSKDCNGNLFPTFPNANYWIGKAQWESAINPNYLEKASFLKENFAPLMEYGKVRFIEKEGELFTDFFVKIYNGHTTGQIVPFIKINGNWLIFGGDLIPSSANIPLAWIPAYDIRPLDTLDEKIQFYQEAIANNYTIVFQHDLYVECAKLIQKERGVRIDKTCTLNEFMDSVKL